MLCPMPVQPPFILAAVLLLHQTSVCGGSVNLRGVSPELEARYSGEKGGFQCLDGSAKVGLECVNDDFCDCLDGSDEPGTSACSDGRFYCRNRGHQPMVLVSQFVDDGVCDCCDGSDEASGKCSNKCVELSREVREGLEKKVKDVKEGLRVKEERVVEGLKMKKGWEAEVEGLVPKVEEQKAVVERVRKEKEEVERVEKEQREKERKEKKENEVGSGTEGCEGESCPLEGPDGKVGEEGEVGSDVSEEVGSDQPEQKVVPDETPGDAGGDGGEAVGEDVASSEGEPNVGDGQCTEGSGTCNEDVGEDVADEEDSGVDEGYLEDIEGADEDFGGIDDFSEEDCPEGDCGSDDDFYDSASDQVEPEEEEQGSSGILGRVASLAEKVKRTVFGQPPSAGGNEGGNSIVRRKTHKTSKELSNAEQELRNLETQVDNLRSKIDRDHGVNDAYLSLEGKCFEVEDDKYKYEMCPFGSAKQVEDGSSTSLGSWHGFDETGRWMMFSGGRYCWNGPNRSLRVGLACGSTDTLMEMTEPSVCEYIAYFQTPGACSQEELTQLQAQLESLDPGEDIKTEL